MSKLAKTFTALRNCANWNEKEAAHYFRKARTENNNFRRAEYHRNATRHTRNAASINQRLSSF